MCSETEGRGRMQSAEGSRGPSVVVGAELGCLCGCLPRLGPVFQGLRVSICDREGQERRQ